MTGPCWLVGEVWSCGKDVRPILQEAQASPNQLSSLFGDTTINSFLCNAPVAFLGCWIFFVNNWFLIACFFAFRIFLVYGCCCLSLPLCVMFLNFSSSGIWLLSKFGFGDTSVNSLIRVLFGSILHIFCIPFKGYAEVIHALWIIQCANKRVMSWQFQSFIDNILLSPNAIFLISQSTMEFCWIEQLMKCYISNESLLKTLASCIETLWFQTEVRLVFVYDLSFGYCVG